MKTEKSFFSSKTCLIVCLQRRNIDISSTVVIILRDYHTPRSADSFIPINLVSQSSSELLQCPKLFFMQGVELTQDNQQLKRVTGFKNLYHLYFFFNYRIRSLMCVDFIYKVLQTIKGSHLSHLFLGLVSWIYVTLHFLNTKFESLEAVENLTI